MRKVVFDRKAFDHFDYWVSNDIQKARKINKLLKEIRRNPFEGTGKPEPLKENLSGHWSRRIDREHRIVYKVSEDEILIISCRYHY